MTSSARVLLHNIWPTTTTLMMWIGENADSHADESVLARWEWYPIGLRLFEDASGLVGLYNLYY